jgi:hypothetical protein
MNSSTSLIRFRRLLVLGSVVAVAAASAAVASGSPNNVAGVTAPDVFERYAAAHPYGSASSPDVLERYAAAHPYGVGASALGTDRIVDDSFRDPTPIVTPAGDRIVDDSFRDPTTVGTAPDVFERYAAAHPYGVGASALGTDRIVDDSFRDPTPIVTPAGDRIVDDYFRDAPTLVTSAPSRDALDWGDFGIGAGAMLGLTLLVAGLGLGAIAMRHHRGGRLETS